MFKSNVQRKMLAFVLPALFVILTGFDQNFDDYDYYYTLFDASDYYHTLDDAGCGSVYDIDIEYSFSGPFDTTRTSINGFSVYHPKWMLGRHAIITWGNGTGAETDAYMELLRHLASWGFVVVASDSHMARSGIEMIDGVDYLLEQNDNPDSIFFGKLDPESIGTTGHSQGGGGSINAATDPRVKCALPIAPARGEIDKIKCPIFLMTGADDNLVPANFVRFTSYPSAAAPTIFGIAQGMNHADFSGDFGKARRYITAWFMYLLKGDKYAAKLFDGECEICNNPDWIIVKKNF